MRFHESFAFLFLVFHQKKGLGTEASQERIHLVIWTSQAVNGLTETLVEWRVKPNYSPLKRAQTIGLRWCYHLSTLIWRCEQPLSAARCESASQ